MSQINKKQAELATQIIIELELELNNNQIPCGITKDNDLLCARDFLLNNDLMSKIDNTCGFEDGDTPSVHYRLNDDGIYLRDNLTKAKIVIYIMNI